MVEGAPLLREYGPKAHRGFESLRLRHHPDLSHRFVKDFKKQDAAPNLFPDLKLSWVQWII